MMMLSLVGNEIEVDMKDYPSYSVCGTPAKNKLLGRFLNHFYKLYTEEKIINGTRYIVEYHRSPFWAYEEPTLKLFIKDKSRNLAWTSMGSIPKGRQMRIWINVLFGAVS